MSRVARWDEEPVGVKVLAPGRARPGTPDRQTGSEETVEPLPDRRSGPDRRNSPSVEGLVFEQLPYALLVLGPSGVVLSANAAARDLLSLRSEHVVAGEKRCCDVFGCGRAPGVLKSVCFTELVGEAAMHRAPIRAELPGARVSLTALPVGVDGSRTVVQVWSGLERREAPGDPSAMRKPELSIFTLGNTRLEIREGVSGGGWLVQRAGEVLRYLVCERHRWVLTDEIAEAIWPNAGHSTVDNVRFVIHDLRRRLEPSRPRRGRSAFILSARGCYRLDTANVRVDADEFQTAVNEGTAAFLAGRVATAKEQLDRALELYTGDFLADAPYSGWAMFERSRLHELATKALRVRIDLQRGSGDVNGVLESFGRLGCMEPFDMNVHREWISTCMEVGRYGEASRHYADLQRRMMREFGHRLPFELSDLHAPQRQLPLI